MPGEAPLTTAALMAKFRTWLHNKCIASRFPDDSKKGNFAFIADVGIVPTSGINLLKQYWLNMDSAASSSSSSAESSPSPEENKDDN